jgi:indole-3-acetate monooxygenase
VRVTGRWPFASGITHCAWAWAGCVVVKGGAPVMTPSGPEIIHVFVPTTDIEIHDTWRVSGLSGTGSHDFSVRDVFVPEQRIFELLDPATHRKEPLYQFPALPAFVFPMVCVSLGIARAALDELSELAQTKVPLLRTAVLADAAVAQVEVAKAEGALGAARGFLYGMTEDTWRTVCDGGVPSRRQLALGRIAATQAVEAAAAVARTANTLAGGSSIYSKSSLQRHMRDAEAVTHHFTVAPHTWEDAGRVLLGRSPAIPVF